MTRRRLPKHRREEGGTEERRGKGRSAMVPSVPASPPLSALYSSPSTESTPSAENTFLFLSPSCWRRTKNAYFSLGWVLYSTKWVKSMRAQHKTHNNQHEPLPPYPPAALPSLFPWVEQWHHQIMAPPLPDTIRRRRAVGLALAVVGLLAWGGKMRGIEK